MSVEIIQLSNYVKPSIVENRSKEWVLNGNDNYYFEYVNNRYIGSPTNSAVINGYCSMIYGKGLAIERANKNRANKNIEESLKVKKLINKKTTRRTIKDFYSQGMAYFQVQYTKGHEILSINHVAVNKIAPNKKNEDNIIEGYWYCEDWSNTKKNVPEYIPAFGTSKEGLEIYCLKPYSLTTEYFTLPKYQSGLPSAQTEEEINNYSLNHVMSGFSAGYIINFNESANYTDEQKEQIRNKIKRELTGSKNANAFILSFNDNKDNATTIEVINSNSSHKIYEALSEQSRESILISHEVVSPVLFGVKDANGFSSNADELFEAHRQTMMRVIKPQQDYITDALEEILAQDKIFVELYFKDLQDDKIEEVEDTQLQEHVCLSNEGVADALIKLGTTIDSEEWELISEQAIDVPTITEQQLNDIIEFARAPDSKAGFKSKQDTSLFKIRYAYKGTGTGEREFCNKVTHANLVYREEDIKQAGSQGANKGFGIKGADNYDIFLYKGGVNCKHFWERKIFLKKGNEQISVNKARKMILALEPSKRKNAMWDKNPKEVSQVAEAKNNFWRYGN